MHKHVVIVNGDSNFSELQKIFKDVDYVSSDYITYESLKSLGVGYLYSDSSNSDEKLSSIYRSSLNWYKDSNGVDVVHLNGISFGPLIARTVISSFGNDYRNYLAFKLLIDKYESISINKRAAPSFKRVALAFKNKINWFDFDEDIDINRESSPVRTIINPYPHIHSLSKYSRLLQNLIMPFMRKKTLIWPDWTFDAIFKNKKDCLILNSTKPWHGYYLSESNKFNKEAENIFPEHIKLNDIDFNKINQRLAELDISWSRELVQLFITTIARVYDESYINIRRCYSIYKELLTHYNPSSIVLPGSTHFGYLIAVQIARRMDIKTILISDGYPVVKDESFHFFLARKGDYIFDKYVAFGMANKELFVKYDGIPKERIVVAESPLVDKVKKQASNRKRHSVIVMAYYPNQHNPNTRWDKRIKTAVNIVKCLIRIGETKIIIKIKDGGTASLERAFYEKCFAGVGLLDSVEIIGGEFNNIVSSAKYIVGQISTALFESICANTPYYIYEPYDSGIMELSIKNSALIEPKDVLRNITELENAILEGRGYSVDDHKYLTDGPSLDSILL